MLESTINTPIIESVFKEHGVSLHLKREDLIHPYISGNKFRKLKYNLLEAQTQKKKTLLTFGGAYSNHIHATAFAGKKYGFRTIGIIRGEELGNNLEKTLEGNTTLAFARAQGMELYFVTRSNYKLKETASYISQLKDKFGDFYLLPEGGTNALAIKGCEEVLSTSDSNYDYICCAVGTGGTLSGLINSSYLHQKVLGFPVLKEGYLHQEIEKNTSNTRWELNRKHYLGGYAKTNPDLISFINRFSKIHQILLDPIYTGKLLFGIFNEIVTGYFPKNSRILAIHTGGLQGITGVNSKLQKQGLDIIKTNYES